MMVAITGLCVLSAITSSRFMLAAQLQHVLAYSRQCQFDLEVLRQVLLFRISRVHSSHVLDRRPDFPCKPAFSELHSMLKNESANPYGDVLLRSYDDNCSEPGQPNVWMGFVVMSSFGRVSSASRVL